MYFRDFATHVSHGVSLPDNLSEAEFGKCIYHIRETFFIQLTRSIGRRHYLPDAAKVNVMFGPDTHGRDYFCALSVVQHWLSDFDFVHLAGLNGREQEDLLMESISGSVRFVARRQGVDVDPIDDAEFVCRELGYVTRYPIKSLSKFHPNRKIQFVVVRDIHRGGESWFVEVRSKHGNLLESSDIALSTNAVHAGYAYKRATCKGDTFTIFDNRGRVTFKLAIQALVEKYS